MKITCQKAELAKGVNIVSKAVPTRTTMAILECILIDASTNEIKLTANDMEIGIETIIEGTIEERGIIALDARFFSDIVRKLTVEECKRLQTIPDDYDISIISNSQGYKCIGNGWTVDVIAHIIKCTIDDMNNNTVKYSKQHTIYDEYD